MRIKDLGNGNFQTFPITDDMIEVEDIDKWVSEHTPQSEKNRQRIQQLKQYLADTDYQAIKYAEGRMTQEEYAPISNQRQMWRDEINRLEQIL